MCMRWVVKQDGTQTICKKERGMNRKLACLTVMAMMV